MTKKHLAVFWKSLATHLLVVAAVALILIPVSAQVEQVIRTQEVESRRTMVATGLDMVSRQLKSLGDILTSSGNETFSRIGLIKDAPAPKDAVTINKVREQVAAIAGSNTLVADIAVLFYQNQMVITSRQSFMSVEKFLAAYALEGMDLSVITNYWELSPLDFSQRLCPCDSISSEIIPYEETAFCYVIPLNVITSTASPRGVAFAFIRRQPVLESMLTSSLQQCGSLELTDRNGESLMTYSALPGASPSPDDVVISLTNTVGTLTSTARLPRQYFNDVTRPIRKKLILSLIIAALVGLSAAFWASCQQSRPMRRLLLELSEKGFLKGNSRDEYGVIRASLESLQLERDSVTQQLDAYQETIRGNLIDRLFHNLLITEEQTRQIMEQFSPFPARFLVCYGQLLVCGSEGKEAAITRLLAADLIRNRLPSGAVFHLLDADAFALIYPCIRGKLEAEKELERLLNLDSTPLQIEAFLAVSEGCTSLGQVSEAFERARMSYLRQRLVSPAAPQTQRVISPSPDCTGASRLRMRDLQELFHLLLAGDAERAAEAADSFFIEDGSPGIDAEQRYYALRGTLLLAWKELALAEDPPELPKYQLCGKPGECLKRLRLACCQTADAALEQQKAQKEGQGEVFLSYLAEHYADPELCATSMASAFGLSEKYLFSLFKERTGQSPASCLQHIRMEQAAKLLESTSLTAQEISVRVGFLNFSTFHKAFKREYGMAPGQYRAQTPQETA